MNSSSRNYNNSIPLHVNSKGSFTYHYAVWPYFCLFTIIILVWLVLYLSTIYSRRHLPKGERYRLSSICQTQDFTTIGIGGSGGGGIVTATEYEVSTVLSPLDV
ncbi:hypothetical protein I4U23_006580 [Adineta vaga]|nr:hypothetical protein I4U23_006580 [Adineta vaga]